MSKTTPEIDELEMAEILAELSMIEDANHKDKAILEFAAAHDIHPALLRAQVEEASGFKWDANKQGIAKDSKRNVEMALACMGVTMSFDRFRNRKQVAGLAGYGPEFSDAVALRIMFAIEEIFGWRPPKATLLDLLDDMAARNSFHPVLDWLKKLPPWDGVARVDTWLTTYAKVKDAPVIRAFGRKWLTAAVRRLHQPGVKFDFMLVLEGLEGVLKSTLLLSLVPVEEWFTDDVMLDMDSRTLMEQTEGVWIVEFAELSGIRGRKDTQHIKALLSRKRNRSRAAYARNAVDSPRSFVFSGTTNDFTYLEDEQNRRFWPARVEGICDVAALIRDREQLWAEVLLIEAAGEPLHLPPDLEREARRLQTGRRLQDPWEDAVPAMNIQIYEPGAMLDRDEFRVKGKRILDQLIPQMDKQNVASGARLGKVMRRLGWDGPRKMRFDDGTATGYSCPTTEAEKKIYDDAKAVLNRKIAGLKRDKPPRAEEVREMLRKEVQTLMEEEASKALVEAAQRAPF